jgi:predicted CXXCH cytochrome family protein
MKKLIIVALALSFAGNALAWIGAPGVLGSKHNIPVMYPAAQGVVDEDADLVAAGAQDSDTSGNVNRVCGFCHTPHHANIEANGLGLPLWSKNLPDAGAYTNYASFTIDGGTDDGTGMFAGDAGLGPSWLCLSCHDGSIAVDQHYNFAGDTPLTGDNYGDPAVGEGGLLDNDHPIGVNMVDAYAAELAGQPSPGLVDPATGLFINNPALGTFPIAEFLYANEYVTCASCHDVHDKDSVQGPYMLYAPVDNSDICMSCHDK